MGLLCCGGNVPVGTFERAPAAHPRLATALIGSVATRTASRGAWRRFRCGVGCAPRRDQEVAAVEGLLAVRRAHDEADTLARPPLYPEGLGRQEDRDPFVPQEAQDGICDVGGLAPGELWTVLDKS